MSFAIAQAGRPSAGGRRASEVLERVHRDGRWWLSQRGSRSGALRCAHCRPLAGLCLRAVRALWLVRLACVSRCVSRGTGSVPRPCASAPPALVACRGRHQPSARACAACKHRGARRRAVRRFVWFAASLLVLHTRWRGKLALMVRNEVLLHQPPNPSIERTANGGLRLRVPSTLAAPLSAAHVER